MKKFKYRLQPVLTVKSHVEKERQKEHAAAVEKVLDQENHLSQLDDTRKSVVDAQRSRQLGRLSLAELLVCSRYLLKLKRDQVAGGEVLRGLQKDANVRQQALLKASMERQIYEKLKEKQKQKHLKEMERLERKDTDEIAANNHQRRHRS